MSNREKIVELVSAYCTIPATDATALELDSLSLIQLVEDLEVAFDIRVLPSEAAPQHFGSVERMVAFVEGKRG